VGDIGTVDGYRRSLPENSNNGRSYWYVWRFTLADALPTRYPDRLVAIPRRRRANTDWKSVLAVFLFETSEFGPMSLLIGENLHSKVLGYGVIGVPR